MPSKDTTNQNFFDNYNNLNSEQKIAVDTIEGPVLVNAGPGTGKTQILATRIGNILLNTDVLPNNILCLTYTDNGAVEMRKRLLKIIGTAAYSVQIHTFHSFCNEIIQENLTYFGKLNSEVIGEIEEIELLHKLIDEIPNDNILKRFTGEIYFERKRLLNLFALLKKEAWTPEYIISKIELYLQELPTKEGFFYKKKYKQFNAGDPKIGAIELETQKMEILKAAVLQYPVFNKLMQDANRYNFDDMILWVLEAFTNNKNLLLNYQEKFLYILVDEFQDTSRSQTLLLQNLINYWDSPNVFVVGDADQSIFSFQDANVQNIASFINQYNKDIVTVDLINNYRSSQVILDSAHILICNNTQRITNLNKPLVAANPIRLKDEILPEVVEFYNPIHEAICVANKIEDLIKIEKISPKDIAVIYRNHSSAESIIIALQQKKININARKTVDVLQIPFVQNIIKILKWIDKENDASFSADDLLFQILHSNFWKINQLEVAKQSIALNEKNRTIKNAKYSLRSWLNELNNTNPNLFNDQISEIKNAINTLENLIKESNNCTIQQLVEMVIQNCGVLTFIMNSNEKPWFMQVLTSLFNYIKAENKRDPNLNLSGLIKNLEIVNKNRINIPVQKITKNENGVNFITAHSSKGSEFEYVFVIDCSLKTWEKGDSHKSSYSLPDNLVFNNRIATSNEESRRLFYVAITRAKKYLQLSYSVTDTNNKEQNACSFITEVCSNNIITIKNAEPTDEDFLNFSNQIFSKKLIPEVELVTDQYINELLQNYSLSVTHLNNYLSCPLKFYYQNLLKVPSAKSGNLVFGSAVHIALELLFKNMKNNNNQFPSLTEFIGYFNWYITNNKEAFTPEEYKLRTDYGNKILPEYYNFYINQWSKIVVIEKTYKNIVIQNIPINGKLDKLEFEGTKVNVVDYKTGKYSNAIKKLQPPSDTEPNGGDYWRQAVFYKLLIDNDKTNNWSVVSSKFEFVEPVDNKFKSAKIDIRPEDITTVTQQIISTWNKIQAKEFNKGCGKPDCDWCNFVKTNELTIALHSLLEE